MSYDRERGWDHKNRKESEILETRRKNICLASSSNSMNFPNIVYLLFCTSGKLLLRLLKISNNKHNIFHLNHNMKKIVIRILLNLCIEENLMCIHMCNNLRPCLLREIIIPRLFHFLKGLLSQRAQIQLSLPNS